MKRIESPADFEEMLQIERAVVFIFFEWSGQAQSQAAIEQWEKESIEAGKMNFVAYQLFPNDQPYTWKWVNEIVHSLNETACPPVLIVWLERGEVLHFLKAVSQAWDENLENLTRICLAIGVNSPLQTLMAPFDLELLKILCCPETHQELKLAAPPVLEKLNLEIAAGQLQNRAGQTVLEKVDGGLVRADGRYLYPMRENIPVLLVDEAIPLAG